MRFPNPEGAFLRALRYGLSGWPILRNGPHALYLALADGRPVARAATGVDLVYREKTGEMDGYIGLFEGEDHREAAEALFRAVDDFQRAQKSARVIGPMPLDAYAFCYGLLAEGFYAPSSPLLPYNPPYYAELFEENGYAAREDFLSFRIPLDAPGVLKIERAGAWAADRFHLTVRRMEPLSANLNRCVRRVLENDGTSAGASDIAAALGSIRPLLNPRYLLVAYHEGRPAGFLLGYPRDNIVHVFTVHVDRENRRRGAFAALAAALITAAREDGAKAICAAVISRENDASLSCARFAGGAVEHVYRVYHKEY